MFEVETGGVATDILPPRVIRTATASGHFDDTDSSFTVKKALIKAHRVQPEIPSRLIFQRNDCTLTITAIPGQLKRNNENYRCYNENHSGGSNGSVIIPTIGCERYGSHATLRRKPSAP